MNKNSSNNKNYCPICGKEMNETYLGRQYCKDCDVKLNEHLRNNQKSFTLKLEDKNLLGNIITAIANDFIIDEIVVINDLTFKIIYKEKH